MNSPLVGPTIVRLAPLVNVLAWIVLPPADDGRASFSRQWTGELIASTAVILLATALLLSTRARWLEPHFGGLDKMYRWHGTTGGAGFVLLIGHVALIPWRLEPGGGVPAGLIAFVGLTVLVILAVGPRLPVTRRFVTLGYGSWRRTHWLVGIFFIFTLAHMFLVDPLVTTTTIPFAFLMAAYVAGIGSFLYGLVLARVVRPTRTYLVDHANTVGTSALEVVMTPRKRPIDHHAGQFVFVRFKVRRLREPHPFTVASGPDDASLKLVIKAAGDFTERIRERLKPGHRARVEGAYGMLDFRQGKSEQVWIAGGIGITPFLSWLRSIDGGLDRRIEFFYTVRTIDQALFTDEIDAIARREPNLSFHLIVSSLDGSLTPDTVIAASQGAIHENSIYLCGPTGMIKAFENAFRSQGVPAGSIHYEEFSFR